MITKTSSIFDLDFIFQSLNITIIDPTEIFVFIISCAFVSIFFFVLESHIPTSKGKAWIVMLVSSFVLSAVGTIYVTNAQLFNLWTADFIYSDDFPSRCIMIYFAASNVMDLILGVIYYPSFLDPFSTVAHHIFYILFISTLLSYGYSKGFMLCFLMEIPTFVLSLGSVWKDCRSDLAFGSSFLLTRILYNAILAYRLSLISFDGVIWKICIGVLCLHIFWFYKWVNVYGKNLLHGFKL